MLDETWEDQYRRLQRSYELLRRVTDQSGGDPELRQKANARDVLFHFCSDALHLRDWIQASFDDEHPIQARIRRLFRDTKNPAGASVALAACADIANGFKHLKRTKPSYTPGGYATVVSHEQGLKLPGTLPAYLDTNHWTIEAGGQMYDAVELADRAIADWDEFLHTVELLPIRTDVE